MSRACRWSPPRRSARRSAISGWRCARARVLGIGGVAGNGQDELLAALSGERRVEPGMIELRGRAHRRHGTRGAAQARTSLRARGTAGACRRPGHEPDGKRGADRADACAGWTGRVFVGWGRARAFAEEIIARFDVRTAGARRRGARPFRREPAEIRDRAGKSCKTADVLIVNQPTWGVDASAAAAIRQALLDLRAERGGGRGHQPGSRRTSRSLRPVLRAQRGAAFRATARARPVDGRDRPDAGRRP